MESGTCMVVCVSLQDGLSTRLTAVPFVALIEVLSGKAHKKSKRIVLPCVDGCIDRFAFSTKEYTIAGSIAITAIGAASEISASFALNPIFEPENG